jgi:cleavage stimulation factor subunit 3
MADVGQPSNEPNASTSTAADIIESDTRTFSDSEGERLPATTLAAQEGSRTSSRSSMRKPNLVGGFIADDSDEESESSTQTPMQTSSSLQPPAYSTPNRAISPSPLQNYMSQQDVQSQAENQGDSKSVQPSYTLPVNQSTAGVPAVQAPTPQTLTSMGTSPQAVSVPKARLPHDTTGILEDRIKEDPRGDLDAWLSLISEHRKRNKLDDARAVYERFFKVFPQAVSLLASLWFNLTNPA